MKTYELHELKSSIIQYNKKVPKFMFWIVLIITLLIAFLITLAAYTKKEDIIRSTGVFTTTQKTSIMSLTGGEIKTIHKQNGAYVEKGDLLISLNTISIDAQIFALTAKVNYLEKQIDDFDLFINSLNELDLVNLNINKNPFELGESYIQFNNVIESITNIELTKTNENGDTVNKAIEEIRKERQNVINQYLAQYYSQKKQYQYEFVANQSQKQSYELSLDSYNVYANETGYLNYLLNLSTGMVIGNDILGTISDKLTMDNGVIEVYVDAQFRSFIQTDTEVEIIVAGLPQSDYGFIYGKVVQVSEDSMVTEDQVLYKVIVKPSKLNLNSKNTNVNIISGQIGEARFKYEKTTWLNWALEKLGIINR